MAYVNTQPEVVTYSGNGSDLQAAVTAAIAAGKSLYLPAGSYDVANVQIGGRLRIWATPGTATLRLANGAAYVFYAGGYDDLTLEGLTFDATGRTHAVDSGLPVRPLVASKRQRAANSMLRVRNCAFRGTAGAGVLVYGTAAEIRDNVFDTLGTAVHLQDADGTRVCDNDISSIAGNAVVVQRASLGVDGALIAGNRISTVTQTDPASTGWEGNGILVYKASEVQITGNRIVGCAYSSIRANYCSGTQIVGNTSKSCGETAIYLEALADGATLPEGHRSVVASNVIEDAAVGIAVANWNYGGRLVAVTGNLLRNIVVKVVSAGTPNQASTGGLGIAVEADAAISGNVVEGATVFGILLGTNGYTRDLACTDNLIRSSPIGIGFSKEAGAGQIFIASNMVRGYVDDAAHGAIVPLSYGGSGYVRTTGADLGQADTSTTWANVRVDRNRCVV